MRRRLLRCLETDSLTLPAIVVSSSADEAEGRSSPLPPPSARLGGASPRHLEAHEQTIRDLKARSDPAGNARNESSHSFRHGPRVRPPCWSLRESERGKCGSLVIF